MKTLFSGLGMALAGILVCLPSARAFPPAPDGLLYGMVKDQYGTPLANAGDTVILQTANGTQVTATIQPGLAIGINYALTVPLDTAITPVAYTAKAITAVTPFKLSVAVNGFTNLPIEMAGARTLVVSPSTQVRQDLTLGTDANGDGIPDAWETVFLAEVKTNVALASVNVTADYAHDGRTLKQEYLLGDYPFNPTNNFSVSLVSQNGGAAVLAFTTMQGRTYTAYGSADLVNWTSLNFTLAAPATNATVYSSYYAASIGSLQIQVIPPTNGLPVQFFRLGLQ